MSEDMNVQKSETITIKKDAIWKYSTFILLALVIVMAFVAFGNNGAPTGNVVNTGTGATTTTGTTAQTTVPEEPEMIEVDASEEITLGGGDIAIIEFSDYECPFCKRHHDQTFPQLKTQYFDEGKATFAFRDFTPTLVNPSYHPNAIPAALAAECVREMGGSEAYVEMSDKLFANQGSNSAENVKMLAKDLGYDIGSCLDSEKYKSEIEDDFDEGQSAGVTGTPGSLVLMPKDKEDIDTLVAMQKPDGRGGWQIRYVENQEGLVGVRISGAYPFEEFQKAIEAGL